MIEIKKAVEEAFKYMNSLYESLDDLSLEEVELSEDEKYWLITFGFNRLKKSNLAIQTLIGDNYERIYKVIKVRSDNGQAVSMKIRNP